VGLRCGRPGMVLSLLYFSRVPFSVVVLSRREEPSALRSPALKGFQINIFLHLFSPVQTPFDVFFFHTPILLHRCLGSLTPRLSIFAFVRGPRVSTCAFIHAPLPLILPAGYSGRKLSASNLLCSIFFAALVIRDYFAYRIRGVLADDGCFSGVMH